MGTELLEHEEGMEALREVVARVWGYSEFRPLQAEAMLASLERRDALVVLATGGGKSLCYQAPALVREGLTVVLSPLISLMQDQIAGLAESGVQAAMLTSAQETSEKREVFQRLRAGALKLLFVSPERFVVPGFIEELAQLGLANLVVDEAHCISHWGHDFRPEYRRIGELRSLLPSVPIQAFTATATPQVRADIVRQLGLRAPEELVGSFDRPNLTYRFLPRADEVEQVLSVIRRHPGEAGIVYCLRRTDVDSLAPELARAGIRCLPYHAGLSAATREQNQSRFLAEEIEVIVATVAFGMGIDRPDVRFVAHAALPKGVEQFAQETGRAGRDGNPSECVMLYSGADYHGWRNLQERSHADARAAGVEIAPEEAERSLARLSEMYGFATNATCRHRFLVQHFGQEWSSGANCGACDVCLGELRAVSDAQRVAQMILSCVVRCEQRYGAGHVADVLRGASTERIRAAGHDQLTTFGLLHERHPREIRHWIEQLVGLDHLRVAAGQYPTLSLTRSGVEVMKAQREVQLYDLPVPPRTRRAAPARVVTTRRGKLTFEPEGASAGRSAVTSDGAEIELAVDATLFERLRNLRRRLARERGVPPYLIFGDRTLQELAALRPTTLDELRGIRGIGQAKLADLGPVFVAEIAAYRA
ncbi:MAG: DNA helicase RecQ [Planctomycetota bacterium]